jgi:S-adenosylmethionine:tRNA ribosyltransferase-isomerase
MKTSDFYYDLPQELIAQDPLEDRSSSRLMHLSLKDGSIEHRHFTDVLDYMEEGDCLVINDTKVIPARLYGHKEETGALIEILLLKRRENDIWECLVKPGKKARPGAKITFGNGILKGEIIDVVDEGNRLIQFHYEGIFPDYCRRTFYRKYGISFRQCCGRSFKLEDGCCEFLSGSGRGCGGRGKRSRKDYH